MMLQSPYASPFPAKGYPAAFGQAPRPLPAVQRPPAPSAPQQPAGQLPPRVARGQTGEQAPLPARPVPQPIASLRMPSPEELGLTPVPAAASPPRDWAGAHRRLQALGASGLHLDPLAEGGWRVSFTLPTAQPDKTCRVQAQDATPEAAVQQALARADELLAQMDR